MPDLYDPISAQMTQLSAQDRLTDFIAELNLRTNLFLICYQTNVSASPTNTLASLSEATFSGYARTTLSGTLNTTQAVDSNNNAYNQPNQAFFASNGGGVANQIYGTALVGSPRTGTATAPTVTGTGGTGGSYVGLVPAATAAVYQAPPAVRITGSLGVGGAAATAVSVLNASGNVASITITAAGSGYTTYTATLDPPLVLIKQNVLSQTGISMALVTDGLPTYVQLIEPSNAQ